MAERQCKGCEDVKASMIRFIETSAFGKLVKQCRICSTLWAIDRDNREPFTVEEGRRLAPPRNRQAFINDPRRRRPQ